MRSAATQVEEGQTAGGSHCAQVRPDWGRGYALKPQGSKEIQSLSEVRENIGRKRVEAKNEFHVLNLV